MRADAGLKTSRRQKEKDERVAHQRGSSSTFLLHHSCSPPVYSAGVVTVNGPIITVSKEANLCSQNSERTNKV